MLQHPDSPYIRCIGFLYLRYVADPSTLYSKWFHLFLYDMEPVVIEANKNKNGNSTVGDYVRYLLTNMNYYGTLLPRLPVSIQREIQVKLVLEEEIQDRAKYHASHSNHMEYFKTIGNVVQAMYSDDDNPIAWYRAVIDRVLLPTTSTNENQSYNTDRYPKFIVTFPEYGNTETVSLGELDMPQSTYSQQSQQQQQQYSQYYDQQQQRYQDDIMNRIRKQERDGVTTTKGKYAKRPMTYKGSLATSSSSNTNTSYSTTSQVQKRSASSTNTAAPAPIDTDKNSHEVQQEKKRKLLDKYG